MTKDDLRLHHSGEIREALIAIEGESGGFELMRHGIAPTGAPQPSFPLHLSAATIPAASTFLYVNP
jgi:hypothetical protein